MKNVTHKGDKGMLVDIPYIPERVGTIYQQALTSVYGLSYDYSQALIALAILAPATNAEKVHYLIQGQEVSIGFQMASSRDGYSRHARSNKYHYRTFKTAIPDTGDVSLIMLNDSLFAPVKDMDWTHVWYHNEEQFKHEVFQRAREIVYDPVKEEWANYLAMYGSSTESFGKPLCGRLKQRDGLTASWMSAGFSVGYLSTNREAWERLIEDGLRKKLITI